VRGGGDEPGPEDGYGGGVEREKMPEAQERVAWVRFEVGGMAGVLMPDGGYGGHLFILVA
jgi:hypothetical protein